MNIYMYINIHTHTHLHMCMSGCANVLYLRLFTHARTLMSVCSFRPNSYKN